MSILEESAINEIKSKFGAKILETNLDAHNRLNILVANNSVNEIALYIHGELGFTHANFCMGTDLDDKIEVSWYVGNINYGTIIVIKTHLDRENPETTSLTYLWNGMDWHERETFGMLGIQFKGHDDLRRLILPDVWEGFPLRNDYEYKKPSYRKPEDELMS